MAYGPNWRLTAELGQLVNLRLLELAGNLLSSLPAELGQLPNLKKLGLSHNPLFRNAPSRYRLAWRRSHPGVSAGTARYRKSWGKLETERLVLRHLHPKDAQALLEILSDEEVRRYDPIPPLSSRAGAQNIIAQIHAEFANQQGRRWGIILKESGQLIGICGYRWDKGNALAELSAELAYAYWGKGIMAEALQAILSGSASTNNRWHRMEAQVVVEHVASLRLFQKLGFQEEGILKERLFINGRFRDMQSFALLRQDFGAIH